MRIKKIQIENYRSIIDQTMDFKAIKKRQCSILLGINEYGKSNILKGMSLKDYNNDLNYQADCNRREAEKNNPAIEVTYFLELEESDIISFKEELRKLNIPESLIKFISIKDIQRKFTFNSDGGPSHFYHLYLKAIQKIQVDKYVLYEGSIQIKSEYNTQEENDEIKNILTKDELETHIEKKLFSFFDSKFPKIIFWKTHSKYLINDLINLEEFKDNHDISIPLKNCFFDFWDF